MISLPGTLIISQITGKYGNFNKAKLTTSIGSFTIKDKRLEQYDEGKYEGTFVVSEIKPYTYIYQNRAVLEILARIDDMTLNETNTLTDDDKKSVTSQEHDPASDEINSSNGHRSIDTDNHQTSIQSEQNSEGSTTQVAPLSQSFSSEQTEMSDETLFGILWPLGDEVKIDSSEDRLKIRDQIARLKDLGYKFDYKLQLWNLPTSKPRVNPIKTTYSSEQF